MERALTPLLLLTIVAIAFSSLVASSDGRTANLNAQSGGKHEARSKAADQTRIPSVGYPYPGEINGYPQDPYGSLVSMYFPASAAGFKDMGIGKDGHRRDDGLKETLNYGGYPQGFYGNPPFGYGYPYPGSIFGFPNGIFGFPGSIFRFPRGLFGFPLGSGGYPGGYGGFPGGPGGYAGGYGGNPGNYGGGKPGDKPGDLFGFPGGYGGFPGGYGGNPGGYGGGKPGDKPGGPGYRSKAEVKGKGVHHN